MTDIQREAETQAEEEVEEKQAPFREPDVGLKPGSPGSCPGPKAGAKPLSHPGIPLSLISKSLWCTITLCYKQVVMMNWGAM